MKAIPRRLWRDTLWVLVIALAVYSLNIGHTGFYDEFYHVLAARSWLEDGSLQVGDGVYTRTPYFTILIAWVFSVFGESLVVGRMVSAVAGTLLVASVFLWTARVANRTAAAIAALLLCFSPINFFLAQIIRFYAIHSLLFWAGAVAAYGFVVSTAGTLKKSVLAIAAIAAIAAALSMQLTTLIGAAGLAAWAIPAVALQAWSSKSVTKYHLVIVGFVVIVIAAASPVIIASDSFAHYSSLFDPPPSGQPGVRTMWASITGGSSTSTQLFGRFRRSHSWRRV